MIEKINDLIIIGGGPAGLTAAIYTSRASIKTLVIEGSPHGGQLTITTDVENFPGFAEGVQGPQLIEIMRAQATKFGAQLLEDNVTRVEGNYEQGFEITTEAGDTYLSKVVLIASGASAKWLGIESETRLRGRGVSACATCDGFFFKNKIVAVVGGGDSAMEEATFLTKFATKVYIVTRSSKEKMRASKFMLDKAQHNSKIVFKYDCVIKDILGVAKVEGVIVSNLVNNTDETLNDVQGVFVAIGHKPNTDFLKGLLEQTELGYIKVVDNTKTNIKGIFAAGDVADYRYRQAITAAGLGCMAALDIEKQLNH